MADSAAGRDVFPELRRALPAQLPAYLARQRWFGGKARTIRAVELTDVVPLPMRGDDHDALLLILSVTYTEGGGESYAMPVLRMAALPSMSEVLSRSIFWISLLGFILVGISVLNIAGLQEQVSRFLHLLPEIVIAMVILFLGLIIANFFSRAALLAAVNAGYKSPKTLSWSIRFVIWILAITMALEELSVARETVIAAFSIVFGALMLGLAIAFGLGGQQMAREFLERNLSDRKKEKTEEPQPL